MQSMINFLVGSLLATVKIWKLAWFRHVTHHDCLSKTILQHILKGGRRRLSRENAGWTSKSGHLCPCQGCSQAPHAQKTGRRSLLNRPSCLLDDSSSQGTELKRTEYSVTGLPGTKLGQRISSRSLLLFFTTARRGNAQMTNI